MRLIKNIRFFGYLFLILRSRTSIDSATPLLLYFYGVIYTFLFETRFGVLRIHQRYVS
jgi:hypothetical protein